MESNHRHTVSASQSSNRLCGEKAMEALLTSHPLVSLTSSAPLLLLLLFCPEELSCPKFSPKLCPELLLFNLWKIRRRPLGFVAIGCRLLDCPLLLGRSELGALCLIFTGEPWVKLPDLLP